MKYLCLAYGDEKDWNVLTKDEQDKPLAQDQVIRKRGALMAAVQDSVTTKQHGRCDPAVNCATKWSRDASEDR
jgi:hypothetical protein